MDRKNESDPAVAALSEEVMRRKGWHGPDDCETQPIPAPSLSWADARRSEMLGWFGAGFVGAIALAAVLFAAWAWVNV